jgi:hypothetical protein
MAVLEGLWKIISSNIFRHDVYRKLKSGTSKVITLTKS